MIGRYWNGKTCMLHNKHKFPAGLSNYWSLRTSLEDVVSMKNLSFGTNAFKVVSKTEWPYGYLSLRVGYCTAPNGVYFNGDFTVTAWIRVHQKGQYSRLINFGNGMATDNIVFAYEHYEIISPFSVVVGSNYITYSSAYLEVNKWEYITTALCGSVLSIYINGTLVGQQTSPIARNILRTNNYVGSNWRTNSDASADIVELRILNRCLSANQIKDEMDNINYYV